jgi:hypothetical protein
MALTLVHDSTDSQKVVNAQETTSLVVKTVLVEKFSDPDNGFGYADRQRKLYPGATVTVRRVSLTDLPVLSILVIQEAKKFAPGYELCKEDFEPLFDKWRYSGSSITATLCRLHKEGHMHRVRQGFYVLTSSL